MIELSDEQAQFIINVLSQTPVGQALVMLLHADKKPEPTSEPESTE